MLSNDNKNAGYERNENKNYGNILTTIPSSSSLLKTNKKKIKAKDEEIERKNRNFSNSIKFKEEIK